jgi:hypothetical protein
MPGRARLLARRRVVNIGGPLAGAAGSVFGGPKAFRQDGDRPTSCVARTSRLNDASRELWIAMHLQLLAIDHAICIAAQAVQRVRFAL